MGNRLMGVDTDEIYILAMSSNRTHTVDILKTP